MSKGYYNNTTIVVDNEINKTFENATNVLLIAKLLIKTRPILRILILMNYCKKMNCLNKLT